MDTITKKGTNIKMKNRQQKARQIMTITMNTATANMKKSSSYLPKN